MTHSTVGAFGPFAQTANRKSPQSAGLQSHVVGSQAPLGASARRAVALQRRDLDNKCTTSTGLKSGCTAGDAYKSAVVHCRLVATGRAGKPVLPIREVENGWGSSRWKEIADWQKGQRRKGWVTRCEVEARYCKQLWFATLTFGAKHKWKGHKLHWAQKRTDEDQAQYMLRVEEYAGTQFKEYKDRVNKHNRDDFVRSMKAAPETGEILDKDDLPRLIYLAVPEYGDKHGRIHFHVLFFLSEGQTKRVLKAKWRGGYTHFRKVKDVALAGRYIAKYATKGHGRIRASQNFGLKWVDFKTMDSFVYPRTHWRWLRQKLASPRYHGLAPAKSRDYRLWWRSRPLFAAVDRTGLQDKPDGAWKAAYPPQYYRHASQTGSFTEGTARAQAFSVKWSVEAEIEALSRADLGVKPPPAPQPVDLPIPTESQIRYLEALARAPASPLSIATAKQRSELQERRKQVLAKNPAAARVAADRIKAAISGADWSF